MIEKDAEQAVHKVEKAKQAVEQAQLQTNLKNVQSAQQQILQAKQQLLNSGTTEQTDGQYITAEQQIHEVSEQMEPARQAILEDEKNKPAIYRTESLY